MFKELDDGILFLDTDTIDPEKLKEVNEKKCQELLEEGIKPEDFSIVRTTNGFPIRGFVFGGIMAPPINTSCCFTGMVSDENKSKSKMLQLRFRETIHFAINGIVSSHMDGNFENRKCIIIEPFEEHINDSNLKNVQPNDLYFDGSIRLTYEAVILTPIDVYEKEKDKEEFQELKNTYKVIVFKGDEELAVNSVLSWLGYTFHTFNMWDFSPSTNYPNQKLLEEEMKQFLIKVSKTNQIQYTNHTFSKEGNDEVNKKIDTYNHTMEVMRKVIEDYLQNKPELFDRLQEKSMPFLSIYSEDSLLERIERIDNVEEFLDEYNTSWLLNILRNTNKWKELDDSTKNSIDLALDEDKIREEVIALLIDCAKSGESLVDLVNNQIDAWNSFVKDGIDPTNIKNYYDEDDDYNNEDKTKFLLNINGNYLCIKPKPLFEVIGEEAILSIIEETNNRINQEYIEIKNEHLSSIEEPTKKEINT